MAFFGGPMKCRPNLEGGKDSGCSKPRMLSVRAHYVLRPLHFIERFFFHREICLQVDSGHNGKSGRRSALCASCIAFWTWSATITRSKLPVDPGANLRVFTLYCVK